MFRDPTIKLNKIYSVRIPGFDLGIRFFIDLMLTVSERGTSVLFKLFDVL